MSIIGKVKLGYRIGENDVVVMDPNYAIRTLPETQFFYQLTHGADVRDYVPLPEGVQMWYNAMYEGESVLASYSGQNLFVIADSVDFGVTLFHYVYDPENAGTYRYSNNLAYRVIQTERSIIEMPNQIRDMSKNAAAYRGLGGMNLNGGVEMPQPEMMAVNDGVSSGVNVKMIQREARSRGYVCGYIMGTAPAITLSLHPERHKDAPPTYKILAKESKPSRPLGVLLALPARCARKGGIAASPSDIMAGAVDYNTADPEEMLYQFVGVELAISLIGALDGRLPEYAKTVAGAPKQWSAESILTNSPEVSFVYVYAAENKKRQSSSQDRFTLRLKTTSDRRSLYTEGNHVCLRALEHTPVTCNSEEDAYRLNEAAFGAWRYRQVKSESRATLDKAISECPSQIWHKQYTINGETVDGIGSCFFMAGAEETTESGEKVMQRELQYFPWYQTGARRPQTGTKVERIVLRTLVPAEGERKARMATHPILYKDNPEHPMFKPYRRFVDLILADDYIREDQLRGLGGRSAAKAKKLQTLSSDALDSLKNLIRSSVVAAQVQAAQDASADRAILQNANGR